MIIAVDFDGTIVQHRYPLIGRERPFAIDTLRKLQREGHILILWTIRRGQRLDEAVEYCLSRGLQFNAVNCNYGDMDEDSRPGKIYADIYIDDRNLGGIPDWTSIYNIITGKSAQIHSSRLARLFSRK